jgi:tetratricopeptide (TPR) repeat protein
VLGWLVANPGWLLILDNVDSKKAMAAVEGLLQDLRGGRIIVTSRRSDFSANFAPLSLDVLPLRDAVAFLLERTERARRRSTDDEVKAGEIAKELDGLALALEQAAAYIAKRRLTFEVYLDKWRAADHSKVLDWFDETVTGYKRAVAVTWQTSVGQLTESGRRLLERLAFLAPEPVPELLLDVPIPGAEDEKLHEALDDLAAYSLVTRDSEGPFFLVHRLIQDVTRRSVPPEQRQQRLLEALGWISAALTGDLYDVGSWQRAEPIAAHALAAANEADDAGITDPTAFVMSSLGALSHSKARYAEAEQLYRRSLAIYESALGPDHVEVGSILNNLGGLYENQGRYAEAEPLHQRSLAIRERTFGPDDPKVATSLNNLALLYEAQGRYAEAEPLFQRSLAIRERSFGPDHLHVGTICNNLAWLYGIQGRFVEAEALHQRSLAIREKTLGSDHPSVAIASGNLAKILQELGRHTEAESGYKRALYILEHVLGPDHPYTGTALNDLAQFYASRNRLAEAEPLGQRSLEINEKVLGPDHPAVATTLNTLARIHHAQGRYDVAAPLYRRGINILRVSSRRMGRLHPQLDQIVDNYTRFLAGRGVSQTEITAERQRLMQWD